MTAARQPLPLREVRRQTFDSDAPGFRERLAEEIARINASSDTAEVTRWIEAAQADILSGDPDTEQDGLS